MIVPLVIIVAAILMFMLVIPPLLVFQVEHSNKFNWREFTALFSNSYFDWLRENEPDWYLH